MKRYFFTYFDHNYLVYGITLFDSLVKSGIDFQLFVLTLSDECFTRLENADLSTLSADELKHEAQKKAVEQATLLMVDGNEMSAAKDAAKVTEKDIDAELKPYIDRATSLKAVKRKAKKGDIVLMVTFGAGLTWSSAAIRL